MIIKVVSESFGPVRAGTRVRLLQKENQTAKVRVISPGWNQFEVYYVPKRLVGL